MVCHTTLLGQLLSGPQDYSKSFMTAILMMISIFLEEREFKLENIVDAGPINYIDLYAEVGHHINESDI